MQTFKQSILAKYDIVEKSAEADDKKGVMALVKYWKTKSCHRPKVTTKIIN